MYGQPRDHRVTLGGGHELAVYEWGRRGDPQLLLVHATGFHGRCWDRVVAALPPGFHCYAVDMRGHGASDQTESYGWDEFGADLKEVVERLALEAAVVVGHSMGGHCAAQLAAALPAAVRALILLDPVIFEPTAYPENRHQMFASVDDHPVARRRNQWDSWQAMRDQLVTRGFYGLWERQVLDDYCRFGSRPADDGAGVSLACHPRVEGIGVSR